MYLKFKFDILFKQPYLKEEKKLMYQPTHIGEEDKKLIRWGPFKEMYIG